MDKIIKSPLEKVSISFWIILPHQNTALGYTQDISTNIENYSKEGKLKLQYKNIL